MSWLIALIEIVAMAALGLFGVEIEKTVPAEPKVTEAQMVVYVESAETLFWRPLSASSPSAANPCPQYADLPRPEPVAEPVFLIEI